MNHPPDNMHRYEVDSLGGRPIVIFIVGFVALVALSFWIVEKVLRHLDASTPPPSATSLVRDIRPTNNAPRLQLTEAVDHSASEDLESLKSHEDDILARLGWSVDRTTHQAAISDQLIQHLVRSRPSEVGK
jgi:hypothetical protein